MRSFAMSIFAAALLASGSVCAQGIGVGVHVGGVGVGAHVGGNGVGAGAHVGHVGAGVGVGDAHYHRVCHGGWEWQNHRHVCRRW